jgi:hypothetical protein
MTKFYAVVWRTRIREGFDDEHDTFSLMVVDGVSEKPVSSALVLNLEMANSLFGEEIIQQIPIAEIGLEKIVPVKIKLNITFLE